MAGGATLTMHPAVANGSYDVARVREDFPALAMKVYGNVYFDNAASAPKSNAAIYRMTVCEGTHCVMLLLAGYGVTAICRMSCALYNTRDEVDTLAESIVNAREFFA